MTLVILSGASICRWSFARPHRHGGHVQLLQSGPNVPMPVALARGRGVGGRPSVVFNGTAVPARACLLSSWTLATMLLARGCALRFNEGVPMSITIAHESFLAWATERIAGVGPCSVIHHAGALRGCAVLLPPTPKSLTASILYALRRQSRGRALRRASLWPRVETLAYVLCGALAGVAGAIQNPRSFIAPSRTSGQGIRAQRNCCRRRWRRPVSAGGRRHPFRSAARGDHHTGSSNKRA
jgi:ribose transport system permease protein